MKLSNWIAKHSQAELVRRMKALGYKITQGAISQWRDKETGEYVVPDTRWLQIEKATAGEVTEAELKPAAATDVAA